MAEAANKAMTVEEFFQWQLAQEDRYELVDGFPVKMMPGVSNFHDVIATNIIAALRPQLRGGPCWIATPDTATRTRIRGIRRSDVTVAGDAGDLRGFEFQVGGQLIARCATPGWILLPKHRR